MNRAPLAVLVVLAATTEARAEPQPVDPVAACKEARQRMVEHANAIADLQERGRYLLTLPDCAHATAAEVAALPEVPPAEPPAPHERRFTFEFAFGPAYANAFGMTELVPGSALALGVGKFLSHDVALSLRLSGALAIESSGAAYVGTLGPNLQLYLSSRAFVGGGAGFGFLAACGSGCGFATTTIGFNARAGFAFSKSDTGNAHIAVEVTTLTQGLATISLLLGFQSL
jgi:hypothetical protein